MTSKKIGLFDLDELINHFKKNREEGVNFFKQNKNGISYFVPETIVKSGYKYYKVFFKGNGFFGRINDGSFYLFKDEEEYERMSEYLDIEKVTKAQIIKNWRKYESQIGLLEKLIIDIWTEDKVISLF